MTVDNLTYNEITLGIGSKRNIELIPIYDPTNRQLSHHRLTVSVESIVAIDIATSIEDIKRRLSKPGQELVIEQCGFGERIVIGQGGGSSMLLDIKGGPHPRLIQFEPMAATSEHTAVAVTWQCEANVFFANSEDYDLGQILSYNYGARYSIDDRGWTTRTISGRLTVKMALYGTGSNQILHNADQFREKIKFAKPEGFKRRQEYDLSEDKSTLSFSIIDEQIKTRQAYPPGVVEISCTHRVIRSRSQLATTRNQISFRCEVAANQPTAYAWFVFQSIVGKRLDHTRQQGVQILIEEITVEDSLFGTEFSASVAYRGLNDLGSWLYNAGIFQPVTLSWDPWEQSVHDIENHHGIANLSSLAHEQDRLTNLENSELPEVEDKYNPRFNVLTPSQSPLCNSLPSPQESWAHFQAQIGIQQSSMYQDQWLPLGPDALEDGVIDFNDISGIRRRAGRKENKSLLPSNPGQITRIQFKGEAIRVGYEIPLPRIEIPGVELKLLERNFKPVFLGIFYCQPVYGAKWDLTYAAGDLANGTMNSGIQTNGSGYNSGNYGSQNS